MSKGKFFFIIKDPVNDLEYSRMIYFHSNTFKDIVITFYVHIARKQ